MRLNLEIGPLKQLESGTLNQFSIGYDVCMGELRMGLRKRSPDC